MEVEGLLPREKADLEGIQALTDAELVALLLNTGNRKEDVIHLSQRLLGEVGGLLGLGASTLADLSIYGIKKAKAYRILACYELEKRMSLAKETIIRTTEDAVSHARKYFYDRQNETALFFGLSRRKALVRAISLTQRESEQVAYDFSTILRRFCEAKVRYVYAFHNHPSGALFPSRQDIQETRRLFGEMENVGIVFKDSLILCGEKFFSFRQNDIL